MTDEATAPKKKCIAFNGPASSPKILFPCNMQVDESDEFCIIHNPKKKEPK